MDALAPDGEEGRSMLRYAARSCMQALMRRFPNGKTHIGMSYVSNLLEANLGN